MVRWGIVDVSRLAIRAAVCARAVRGRFDRRPRRAGPCALCFRVDGRRRLYAGAGGAHRGDRRRALCCGSEDGPRTARGRLLSRGRGEVPGDADLASLLSVGAVVFAVLPAAQVQAAAGGEPFRALAARAGVRGPGAGGRSSRVCGRPRARPLLRFDGALRGPGEAAAPGGRLVARGAVHEAVLAVGALPRRWRPF